MLAILSPSKDMLDNAGGDKVIGLFSLPKFTPKAEKLMRELRKLSCDDIAVSMKVSNSLAERNFLRFQQWNGNHSPENSTFAVWAYTGEAYRGLKAGDFSIDDLIYSQQVLRIFSGLYGLLRPLDLIQPYRLEMGAGEPSLPDLKDFWSDTITASLNEAVENSPGEKVLINLASLESSSFINFSKLKYPVITPVFKEERSGKLKSITIYMKHARGAMVRFIIKNTIETSEELKAFDVDGYYFSNYYSIGNNWLFVR